MKPPASLIKHTNSHTKSGTGSNSSGFLRPGSSASRPPVRPPSSSKRAGRQNSVLRPTSSSSLSSIARAPSVNALRSVVQPEAVLAFLGAIVNGTGTARRLEMWVHAALSNKYGQTGTPDAPSSLTGRRVQHFLRPKAKSAEVDAALLQAERALVALILKMNGCAQEAMTHARFSPFPLQSVDTSAASNSEPPAVLLSVWRTASYVVASVLKHQTETDTTVRHKCDALAEKCYVLLSMQIKVRVALDTKDDEPIEQQLRKWVRGSASNFGSTDDLKQLLGILTAWKGSPSGHYANDGPQPTKPGAKHNFSSLSSLRSLGDEWYLAYMVDEDCVCADLLFEFFVCDITAAEVRDVLYSRWLRARVKAVGLEVLRHLLRVTSSVPSARTFVVSGLSQVCQREQGLLRDRLFVQVH